MAKKKTAEKIGGKLRNLREERGLSLRALASLCGITAGGISQIENNAISPSVGTLKSILTALDTSLTDFFSSVEEEQQEIDFVCRAKQLVDVSPQPEISFLGLPSQKGRKIQLLAESFAPGAQTEPKMIVHKGEECGYCISGTMELTVGKEKSVLGPGDVYYFKSTIPHSFRNIGSRPARIVSACTPSSF